MTDDDDPDEGYMTVDEIVAELRTTVAMMGISPVFLISRSLLVTAADLLEREHAKAVELAFELARNLLGDDHA